MRLRKFWKVLAICEAVVILSGIALVFIYADYKAGNLPYTAKDILSLIASVTLLGVLIGGYIGWVIILTYLCEKRQEGGLKCLQMTCFFSALLAWFFRYR